MFWVWESIIYFKIQFLFCSNGDFNCKYIEMNVELVELEASSGIWIGGDTFCFFFIL